MTKLSNKNNNFSIDGIYVPGCREELLEKYRERYGQDIEITEESLNEEAPLGHWPIFLHKLEHGEKVTIRGWQIPARFRDKIPLEQVMIMSTRFDIDGEDILRPATPTEAD